MYIINKMQRVGSRAQVMHGNAKMTGGGLKKKDLKYNKQGKIVSKKMSALAKKEKRLQKAGYTTKKGQFGSVKVMKGGASNNGVNSMSVVREKIAQADKGATEFEIPAKYRTGQRRRTRQPKRMHRVFSGGDGQVVSLFYPYTKAELFRLHNMVYGIDSHGHTTTNLSPPKNIWALKVKVKGDIGDTYTFEVLGALSEDHPAKCTCDGKDEKSTTMCTLKFHSDKEIMFPGSMWEEMTPVLGESLAELQQDHQSRVFGYLSTTSAPLDTMEEKVLWGHTHRIRLHTCTGYNWRNLPGYCKIIIAECSKCRTEVVTLSKIRRDGTRIELIYGADNIDDAFQNIICSNIDGCDKLNEQVKGVCQTTRLENGWDILEPHQTTWLKNGWDILDKSTQDTVKVRFTEEVKKERS
jgi:hypothetical protein